MAQQQEDGWPLGLRPLNARVGLVRNRNNITNGSISFSTLLTGSPPSSSTDSSSDLDTQSTGSFFHDKSITLGSLIGVSSILELSRRSNRIRTTEAIRDQRNSFKPKPWLFSLCSRLCTDAVNTNSSPSSLGHFLQAERRAAAANIHRRSTIFYRANDDFSPVLPGSDLNPLFVGGQVAAPSNGGGRSSTEELLEHGTNGYGSSAPLLLSCLCGHLIE